MRDHAWSMARQVSDPLFIELPIAGIHILCSFAIALSARYIVSIHSTVFKLLVRAVHTWSQCECRIFMPELRGTDGGEYYGADLL